MAYYPLEPSIVHICRWQPTYLVPTERQLYYRYVSITISLLELDTYIESRQSNVPSSSRRNVKI